MCACAVSNSEYGGAHNVAPPQRTSLLSNVVSGHKAGAKGKLRRCELCIFVHSSRLVMDVSIHFKRICVAAVSTCATQARRSSQRTRASVACRELNTCLHLYDDRRCLYHVPLLIRLSQPWPSSPKNTPSVPEAYTSQPGNNATLLERARAALESVRPLQFVMSGCPQPGSRDRPHANANNPRFASAVHLLTFSYFRRRVSCPL